MKTDTELEEIALKEFPISMINGDEYWIPRYDYNKVNRQNFIKGYKRAFEDIKLIINN